MAGNGPWADILQAAQDIRRDVATVRLDIKHQEVALNKVATSNGKTRR